jgi:hypothetical protein
MEDSLCRPPTNQSIAAVSARQLLISDEKKDNQRKSRTNLGSGRTIPETAPITIPSTTEAADTKNHCLLQTQLLKLHQPLSVPVTMEVRETRLVLQRR